VADDDYTPDNDETIEPDETEEAGNELGPSDEPLMFEDERIDELLIEEEMKDAYLTYAM